MNTATAESFECIMSRNNTTFPASLKTKKDVTPSATNLRRAVQQNIFLIAAVSLVLCFCMASTTSAASIQRRDIASATENMSGSNKICPENTPCGWAIYIPFTRRIDYFMKNTCTCHSSLACIKTDDDLSVNAYVYRCKTRPPATTTDNMLTTI